jgi:hypothetical protein
MRALIPADAQNVPFAAKLTTAGSANGPADVIVTAVYLDKLSARVHLAQDDSKAPAVVHVNRLRRV